MISTIHITSGYAAKLPNVKDKTFSFTPGLNILFGPNGCGKTTVLLTAAAYAGCGDRGWSNPVGENGRPMLCERGSPEDRLTPYPDRFALTAPGKCKATVSWDGVPAFLHTVDIRMSGRFSDNAEEFNEQLGAIMVKQSAGQSVVGMLVRMKQYLAKQPDLTDEKKTFSIRGEHVSVGSCNDIWEEYITSFVAYVKSLPVPSEKRVTVLVDEPDKALSIPNQHVLWTKVLPSLAEKYQVITASHSIFSLAAPSANIIEMEAEYVDECERCVRLVAKETLE